MGGRRAAGLVAGAAICFVVLGGVVEPQPARAAGQPFTFNWLGTPSAPQSVVPVGWDVQIHRRDPSDAMEPMNAGHGTNCGAPPATHAINTLAQGVFICNNHLMTSVGDSGYGEIVLTPNHMADWSTGTTSITFNVSTQQYNDSDWTEVWVVPFADNTSMPFEDQIIDFQGPPRNAIIFSLNQSGLMGTHSGDVQFFQNLVQSSTLPKLACTFTGSQQCINPLGAPSVVASSAVTRVAYEIDISSGHIRFGLPGIITWTDTDINVPFTRGIVQLVHHSYNPLKHAPGTGVDTYHWSNFGISNAIPFTIINGAERSTNNGTSRAIHFPAPAPTGSFLRFSAIGSISVSWDGGATYHPAVLQVPETHPEHFSTYMTPIPAGTRSVLVNGTDNALSQPWWVRDPAIWSETASPPCAGVTLSANPASPSAPPATVTWTASATGCSNPRFRFWLAPPGAAWSIVQDYSSTNTFGWSSPNRSGSYRFEVDARDATSSVSYDVVANSSYVLQGAGCGSAQLGLSPASPAGTGSAVTMTGSSSGCANPRYRFWVKDPGRHWSVVQDYSPSPSHLWTQTGKAGSYALEVDVRDAASAEAYDSVAGASYLVNPCSAAALGANPGSPQSRGTPITLTGTATCLGTPTYRFWVRAPGGAWSIVRDYSTLATFTWTPSSAGSYSLEVDVRNQGATAVYEAVGNATYPVT